MDVRMPGTDGIAATRRLLDDPTFTGRVLMLTTFDLDEYVYEAIRAGASGFLLKDVLPADLLHAVRLVNRGEALLAPSLTRRLLEEYIARLWCEPGHSARQAAHRSRPACANCACAARLY
jgi:DNA-binding NarL/FixJ family response regulator